MNRLFPTIYDRITSPFRPKINESALATVPNEPAQPLSLVDSDGIPPGLDRKIVGLAFNLRFSGKFYGLPADHAPVSFTRLIRVVFASTDILVCQDLNAGNLYVVDRHRNLSLGCLMHAKLEPIPQHKGVYA